MADELRIGLSELLRKAMIEQDADFLKEGVQGALPGAHGDGGPRARGRGASRAELPGAQDSATVTGSAPGTRGWGRWS